MNNLSPIEPHTDKGTKSPFPSMLFAAVLTIYFITNSKEISVEASSKGSYSILSIFLAPGHL